MKGCGRPPRRVHDRTGPCAEFVPYYIVRGAYTVDDLLQRSPSNHLRTLFDTASQTCSDPNNEASMKQSDGDIKVRLHHLLAPLCKHRRLGARPAARAGVPGTSIPRVSCHPLPGAGRRCSRRKRRPLETWGAATSGQRHNA